MKERPILFSAPMVRAILSGQKTQTRRIAKDVRHPDLGNWYTPGALVMECEPQHVIDRCCPHGRPGDRLWVRETFVQGYDADSNRLPMKTWYRASDRVAWSDDDGWETNIPWRPSIHMPRSACRILLEVTAVRVERLQDISEADAQAEGVEDVTKEVAPSDPEFRFWRRYRDGGTNGYTDNAIASFASLWTEINGPGSWEANPWVWVVEFKRIEQEVDAAQRAQAQEGAKP